MSETLLDVFAAQVARSRSRIALRHKLGGTWRVRTWADWEERGRELASGLCALGVRPGDRVAILAGTRVSWVEADLAVLLAGGVSVAIYPSLQADAVHHILVDSGAKVLFAEDPVQVEKLQQEGLPEGLERVVLLDRVKRLTAPDPKGRLHVHIDDVLDPGVADRFVSFGDLIELGRERMRAYPRELGERGQHVTPEHPATLVYTSGTEGTPKGVVLSHGALAFETSAVREAVPLGTTDEQLLFLPLAHIFARLTIFLQWRVGYVTAFAGHILNAVDDCEEVQPTFLVSVPRLYEKIHETVQRDLESSGDMRQRVWDWAFDVGRRVSEVRRQGKEARGVLALEHRYAERIVFRNIKRRLGGKMRFMVSGAAPLGRHTAEFFHAAGILLLEGYGLTENAGAATVNLPHRYRLGSVGRPLPGVQVRIDDEGEILIRGANLMDGYWNDEAASSAALDEEGWLHTGDIGRLDEDGFLHITDRKKDVLITAGGKKIAPQRIEGELEKSPIISHAIVVADRHKYAVALVTLAEKPLREWAREQGLSGDLESLTRHPRVRELVGQAIEAVNQKLASYETVKRFAILERDLAVDRGELTPTLKLRRKIVLRNYASEIDALYREA